VALLDRVNRALNSHDIVAAAASMSEYRTIFPHGALAAAAAAVDFEIARQQGDRATAIARGTEFLQQYPTSPLRKRIEARLQELQPQESP
jgi:outer membrane protein assembly factor BamD (BamD/ComL family)